MNKFFKLKNAILSMVLVVVATVSLLASSHREAPLISNDPLADNVDLYAFRSPDNPDMITIIATYVPLQLPHGGPNYYSFGENIRYEIHVDNDAGLAGDEVTYRFTFNKVNEDPTTFFNIRLGAQNLKTTYNLERSMDGGNTWQMIVQNGVVPPNNIGPRSIESAVGLNTTYDALFQGAITQATTGETVFAGPTDDPFFVDLGGIFDLGDAPRQNGTPVDGLACYNVSALAIQVPISTLLKAGAPTAPTNILDSDYVIGVWASASRPAITTLSADSDPNYSGDWVQVSRLGMPLTNEAVIAIGDKDYWNSITPYDEISETTLDEYFYNPELALYMDDDQFGGAVPAFAPLRIQTASLGAFDFSNGADGLFGLKGTPAVAGTALDDAIFGTLLLPEAGKPRSVDLWPAFHTGVPNFPPYQLATGKMGNPLAAGKPFVNNFLPNGGDMLRLNMAVPVTPRDDANFSSLGLIQAAAIGLTVAPFNTTADLEFIPNMDGFPNGRRLEDDVTRIELQTVGGVVLAAIGLWYDDYDPDTSPSPVTQDLLNVLTYSTGVEKNDRPFTRSFPYLAQPFSGTGNCSGEVQPNPDGAMAVNRIFLSSNTSGTVGIYDVLDDNTLQYSSFSSQEADADGIYYDQDNDVLYQLNRTDNVINAYSDVANSVDTGMSPPLTATSTSDFINGREIAVIDSKLVVAQDANAANGDQNRLIVYNVSPTSITLDKIYDVEINLWGIHLDGGNLWAIEDNSNRLVAFSNFFLQPEGPITPTTVVEVEGLVRTHGISYIPVGDMMLLTDVGAASSPDDGAIISIWDFSTASADGFIGLDEQTRVEGPSTFLGNPVDIAFDAVSMVIFVAERANGGGRLLGFRVEDLVTGDVFPIYNESFAGASAIHLPGEENNGVDCSFVDGGSVEFTTGGTETTIIIDGNPDMLSFESTADPMGGGYSFTYVVTDSDGNILGIPPGNMVDFDPAGIGACLVYGLSYTGNLNIEMGDNLLATGLLLSDECFELSDNFLTVNRIAPGTGADLSLSISVNNLLYDQYEHVTYLITVTNDGPEATDNVSVAAGLPDGMVYSDDDPSKGDYSLFFQTWDVGSLDSGESATLELVLFTLVEDEDITNFVQVLTSSTDDPDSTPGNDMDQTPDEDDEAAITITPIANGGEGGGDGSADLELSISTDAASYDQYDYVTYTVTLYNDGPDATSAIIVDVPKPDGMAYSDDEATIGEYNLFYQEWTIDDLAAGETAVLTLVLFTKEDNTSINLFTEVRTSFQPDPDSTPGNDVGQTPDEDDEALATIQTLSIAPNTPDAIIGSNNSSNGMNLYPNPVTSELTLEFNVEEILSGNLYIYNVDGRRMIAQEFNPVIGFNKVSIETSSLSPGLYYLYIPNENGEAVVSKFVKE